MYLFIIDKSTNSTRTGNKLGNPRMIWLLLLQGRHTQDIAPRVESHKRMGVGGSGPLILTAGDEELLGGKDYPDREIGM